MHLAGEEHLLDSWGRLQLVTEEFKELSQCDHQVSAGVRGGQ